MNSKKSYTESFGRLASGQSPDTLFVACLERPLVPNTFASTNPGDLFAKRHLKNLISIKGGHSECGAMRALVGERSRVEAPNLKSWFRHGDLTDDLIKSDIVLEQTLTADNKLSKLIVLQQIKYVKSYQAVRRTMRDARCAMRDARKKPCGACLAV